MASALLAAHWNAPDIEGLACRMSFPGEPYRLAGS
jgi:hypothetical protein